MDFSLLLQMLLAIFGAIVLYTFIGFVPGTDETSVLMPVTLAIVLAGVKPIVVLTFFISAIITLNLMNAIPTALVGLPGGVMSTPMIEHALFLKEKGMAAASIKKMATGSVIGTAVAIPVSLLLANILAPFSETVKDYASLLFVVGAVFLALIGKNKIFALISIIPLALLFQGLRYLYWGIGAVPQEKTVTTSFFLGITIGPLIVSLLGLLNKQKRVQLPRHDKKDIFIKKADENSALMHPLKTITKKEAGTSAVVSLLSNFLFFLSPVGLTILFGEITANREKDPVKRASMAITSMSALSHATYLSGVIIPLIALGIPLSPVAVGPANALFNAPPVFTLDNNIHHLLSKNEFIFAIILASVIASVATYLIAMKYAQQMTAFVLKKIPHEAILGLFVAFIFLLAYMDAGFINVFGVLLVGIVCGTLNNMGVNYGVQFMILYAAPWITAHLLF
ncbi:tripartite tricarboxylate transporter permease [Enterococcus sp. CWB-B31]|uniref:tripartite tricarboxylate transporter permease n=1 Tax=Enterococcus sp. CWB-B31 TaxID=2885159 RepID=UPI001E399DCB|nr:tripartite tricarboxylate transporter permease [Enterococcus sp. CWB-B31]MCB5954536.1 tripartite tricarboxylate transporter permease [Enterococcus sp. CWB-B31]